MNFEISKHGILIIGVFLMTLGYGSQAQEVRVIKYEDLDKIIQEDNDGIKVINFWATWCKPCIKELPQFEALYAKYDASGLDIILVSFDFSEDLDTKLKPFVKKKKIASEVVLLDETDYDSFIDKIDSNWSGAIPATLMLNYRNGSRKFFEKEFKEGELEKEYLQFID